MDIFEWFIKIHWIWKLLIISGIFTIGNNVLIIVNNIVKGIWNKKREINKGIECASHKEYPVCTAGEKLAPGDSVFIAEDNKVYKLVLERFSSKFSLKNKEK